MKITIEVYDQVLSEIFLVDPAAPIPEVIQSRKKSFKKGPCIKQLRDMIQWHEENEIDFFDRSMYQQVLEELIEMSERQFENLKNQLIQNYEGVAKQNLKDMEFIQKNTINPVFRMKEKQVKAFENEKVEEKDWKENQKKVQETEVENMSLIDRIKHSFFSEVSK